jgi:hypothetical protein
MLQLRLCQLLRQFRGFFNILIRIVNRGAGVLGQHEGPFFHVSSR